MSLKSRIIFNIIFFSFSIMCVRQWFFAQREDWPFTYYGMYKKRIHPYHIFSFRVFAQKHDGTTIDAYSLGSFNYYAFTDAIESILRDRIITPDNTELSASRDLLLDKERVQRLENLFKKDWNPHLMEVRAENKIKSFRLVARYWRHFEWEKRNTPDVEKILLTGSFKEGRWSYDSDLL